MNNYKYGIINNRCYGKKMPCKISLYKSINDNMFDRNQLTEINIDEPCIILKSNKNWYLIKIYNYICWVKKKYITIVNKYIFNYYLNNNKFVIIINNNYTSTNKYLEIGTKLKYLYEDNKYYYCVTPSNIFVRYTQNIINVKKEYANKFYIQFSKDNYLKYIYNYINTTYGWGGYNNGVDCSGLICNTFKIFGIYIPRDTCNQKYIVGNKIIDVSKASRKTKKKLLYSNKLVLIYLKGHVMVVYKYKKEDIYIIHASSKKKKVLIQKLTNKKIDEILFINSI